MIGKVAYCLQLPSSVKIHNVFHVSQLKRYEGKANYVNHVPLTFWEMAKEPEKILARRMVKRGNKAATQILVQWKGANIIESTWEDLVTLKGKFPLFDLTAEVVSSGGTRVKG